MTKRVNRILLFILFIVIGAFVIAASLRKEGFTDNVSKSIDLPLTTTQTCKNFCGPRAICAMTGDQCSNDADCPGCQAIAQMPVLPTTNPVPGYNDRGDWIDDLGTTAFTYRSTDAKPDSPFQGTDVWTREFDQGIALHDKRYNPSHNGFIMSYPKRTTLSGEFVDDGPMAANTTM